eukprot:335605-Rhodomonas_salina.3
MALCDSVGCYARVLCDSVGCYARVLCDGVGCYARVLCYGATRGYGASVGGTAVGSGLAPM